MSHSKRFLKSSIVFFIGNVLSKLVSVLMLPIFTSYIEKSDMGYFDYSTNMVIFFATIVFLNIWAGILRYMYDYSESCNESKAISNGFMIFLISLSVYTILQAIIRYFINIDHAILVYLFGVMTILHYIYGNIARGFGYNKLYAMSGVVSSLVAMSSNVFFIFFTSLRIESLYLSVIFGYAVQLFIIELKVGVVRRFRLSELDFSLFKELIKFCAPLSISNISNWFLLGFGRYAIISHDRFGLAANGLYSTAGRFSGLLSLITSSFILAWQDLAFSQGEEEKDKENSLYNRAIQKYLSFLALGIPLGILSIAIVFPVLINKQYSGAYQLIPLLFTATGASVFVDFFNQIFVALKRTRDSMMVYIVGAITNVVMIYLLLPNIGLQGVSVALLIANLVMISAQLFLANRVTKINLFTRELFTGIVTIAGSIVVFLAGNKLMILICLLLISTFYLILYRMRIKGLLKLMLSKRGTGHNN